MSEIALSAKMIERWMDADENRTAVIVAADGGLAIRLAWKPRPNVQAASNVLLADLDNTLAVHEAILSISHDTALILLEARENKPPAT